MSCPGPVARTSKVCKPCIFRFRLLLKNVPKKKEKKERERKTALWSYVEIFKANRSETRSLFLLPGFSSTSLPLVSLVYSRHYQTNYRSDLKTKLQRSRLFYKLALIIIKRLSNSLKTNACLLPVSINSVLRNIQYLDSKQRKRAK